MFESMHANLGQYQRAVEDFDNAIRLDPQYALAYSNRALAYTLLEKYTEAQQDVDQAVELGQDRALLEKAIEKLKKGR